jgi:ferredoxin
MTWTDTSATGAGCGSCHGDVTKSTLAEKALPKTVSTGGTHPDVDLSQHTCSYCHGRVINSSMEFVDLSKHINGKVD